MQFLGIFSDDTHGTNQKWIVTEYLNKGSLDVLLKQEKTKLTTADLIGMYVWKENNSRRGERRRGEEGEEDRGKGRNERGGWGGWG